MKVSRILATKGSDVLTVHTDQTVKETVQLLAHHNIGALVVVNDAGELAGIVSERDVVRHLAQREDALILPVSEIMTRNVITALPQDDLMSISHVMTERRFRHLPIMDGSKLVGVISIGDVLKAQRDAYRGEIDTLEAQILEK